MGAEVAGRQRLGPEVKQVGDMLAKGDVILVEPVTKDAKGKELPAGTFGFRQTSGGAGRSGRDGPAIPAACWR